MNKHITEEELKDLYYSLCAVQDKNAEMLTLGVFLKLLTYDSIIKRVINNAREVYSIPITKGNGTYSDQ